MKKTSFYNMPEYEKIELIDGDTTISYPR